MMDAKEIQFARLAGLTLAGVDEYGTPEWMGNTRQFKDYYSICLKDDRGEYQESGYPWQPINF